jgi:hypothetical protein
MGSLHRLAGLVFVAVLAGAACSGGGDGPRSTSTSTIAGATTTTVRHEAIVATTAPTAPSSAPGQRMEPSLPLAIQEAAAASTNGRLYVMGGYDTGRNSRTDVFIFDGAAWQQGPSLPVAVNHPGAAAIDGDVYVAGGFTANGATGRVFVLGADAGAWREVAPMHRARGALALVSWGGVLYAVGGRDGSTQVAVPEAYDVRSNAWRDLPAMPAPRNHVAGYVNGARVCVAGGRTPATSAAIDCLDTATQTWQTQGHVPVATSGAAAAALGGIIVVAGGEPSGETQLVTVVQMLRAQTWSEQPMLVPRHGTAFATYHGRLWTCGGATAPGFHAVDTCTSLGA